MAAHQLHQIAKNLPTDSNEREELYHAARNLMLKTESPRDTHHRLYISWVQPLVQTGIDLDIFSALDSDPSRSWSLDELMEKTGADKVLLARILRALAAHGTLAHISPTEYQATNITTTLASDTARRLSAGQLNFCGPFMHALPAFLRENGYRNPLDPKDSPFQKGHRTELSTFEWLRENPEVSKLFFDMMPVQRAGQVGWMQQPSLVEHLSSTYLYLTDREVKDRRAVFVDVGGGAGHQCVALREAFPNMSGRVVLQDLDYVTKSAAEDPGLAKADIEIIAQDFNTPQPASTKGAKVYYLRNIFHNHSDDQSVPILTSLHDAMAADSVIVVEEMVMPEMDIGVVSANFDSIMMGGFASMQRTQAMWAALFSRAGLVIREKLCYDEGSNDCLMIVQRSDAFDNRKDSPIE